MPRVNNESTAVANRAIEKFAALVSELKKYETVRTDLKKIDPTSPTYSMMTDYLNKIEVDRASIVNTLLGMHEKVVTQDFSRFVDFIKNWINDEIINDADAKHVEQFENVI